MLAHDLTDDPFKAALGNVRGSGRDDTLAMDEGASDMRIDLNYEYFIVLYPDGDFLARERDGETWMADWLLHAARFRSPEDAEKCMNSNSKEDGEVYRITSVLLKPWTKD